MLNRGSFRSAFISPSRDPTFVARMPEYISSAGVLCICMYFWLDLNWTGEALGWVGTIGGEWWGELCVGEEERGRELDRRRGCGCGIMRRCLQQPFMQYLPIKLSAL